MYEFKFRWCSLTISIHCPYDGRAISQSFKFWSHLFPENLVDICSSHPFVENVTMEKSELSLVYPSCSWLEDLLGCLWDYLSFKSINCPRQYASIDWTVPFFSWTFNPKICFFSILGMSYWIIYLTVLFHLFCLWGILNIHILGHFIFVLYYLSIFSNFLINHLFFIFFSMHTFS